MKEKIAVLVFILMFLPASVWAEQILFASSGNLPPYIYEENGKMTGINTDVVIEVCKRIGIEPKFEMIPAKRYLEGLKNGSVDAAVSLFKTQQRMEFLYYPSEPINIIKNVIMAPKQSEIKINSIADLKGKSIAIVSAYAYTPDFDSYEEAKKEVCYTTEILVQILQKGRVELAATQKGAFEYVSKKLGFADQFKEVYFLGEKEFYPVFSKAVGEKNRIIAEKFGEIIIQLKKEGVIDRITESY